MNDCIFCKIRDLEIPTEFVYEDEEVMVINDLHPVKPIHMIVIPKKHVAEFVAVEDLTIFQKLGEVAQRVIRERELTTKGYKLVINGGGSQEVDHLHIHIMGPMNSLK